MGVKGIIGLKLESAYNETINLASPGTADWHHEASKASSKLNDEPVKMEGGSRASKGARAGYIKPTASFEGSVDLKRLGHYILGALGNYVFTAGGTDANVHEFYGSNLSKLPSFRGYFYYDYFVKYLGGMLVDGLKIESGGDDFASISADFIYANEKKDEVEEADFEEKEIDGAIPLMLYDLTVELDEISSATDIIVSEVSLELKNNHNTDTINGASSRNVKKKATAQAREVTAEITTAMEAEILELLTLTEYGEEDADEPSACKLYTGKLTITAQICENTEDKLTIILPSAIFTVEYESSGADEIEVKFKLDALSKGKVTLADETTEKVTDIYCKIENDQPKIEATRTDATIIVNVKDNDTTPAAISGKIVTLKNKVSGTEYTSAATDATGDATISNVPYGRYEVKVADKTVVSPKTTAINEGTETVNITVQKAT